MAIAALESGSNVLCEKPVAPTYAEAVEMFEAAEKAGRVLTVGSHFRFGANTQIARRQADAGFFGNIYAARTTWHRRSGIPGMGGWFTNRDLAKGGVLFDLGVHALDRALYIMDYPRPVAVSGALFAEFGPRGLGAGGWGMDAMQPVAQEKRRFDVEDLAWAFVRFANGAVLQFQVAWAAHFPDFWTTELFGSEGGARLNEQNEIELYSSVNGQDAVIQVKGPDKAPWSYAEQVRHFVRHLQGDPSAEIVTPEQALTSVRIVDAIARSAAAGHEVTL
jgi:predicted dehydrogenase